MRKLLLSATSVAALAIPAHAEVSDGKVKIGILNDQSGVYADFGGKYSYEAAKMAVEDFGGKVLDAPVEVVTADHQNKADIASNIAGRSFCALGDASATPVLSGIKRFRGEFEAGYTSAAHELFPYGASAIVESAR